MAVNILDVGVDPNCWFAVVREKDLKKNRALPVTIWHQDLVVYRDHKGNVHTLENRCGHRKVALDSGEVRECRLVCPYHGWEYDSNGRLSSIPYWPSERKLPKVQLKSFPTKSAGGLHLGVSWGSRR